MTKHDDKSKKRCFWLVDYDLPDQACRRQFYEKTKKVIGEGGLRNLTSSKSVVKTANEKIARAVHELASACGVSHMYKVVETDACKNESKPSHSVAENLREDLQ
jgi:hypothetical protein